MQDAPLVQVKSHFIQSTPPATLSSALKKDRAVSPSPDSPPASLPPLPDTPGVAGPSEMVSLNLFANPHYASQMVPTLTAQYALEQALE
jgi:hypothetical protein